MNRKKGSLALESALVLTLLMVTLITLFGIFYSLSIDVKLQWAMSQVADEIALLPRQAQVSPAVCDLLLKERLEMKIKDMGFQPQIHIKTTLKSSYTEGEALLWKVFYEYRFLSVKKQDTWQIPIKWATKGDGVDYLKDLVFVTHYGEKYHHDNCQYLWKSRYLRDQGAAEDKGYTPCKVCYE